MMRRLLVFLNVLTFVWTQNLYALSPENLRLYNEFLKASQITQHEISLKELEEKFTQNFPEPVRAQLQAIVSEYPDAVAPKIDVKKINVSGEEQLQFSVHLPEANLIFTTVTKNGVWGTVVGVVRGRQVKAEIPNQFLTNGAQTLYQARLAHWQDEQAPKTLPVAALEKMSDSERASYIKSVRKMMETAERVQNIIHGKSNSNNSMNESHPIFNEYFVRILTGQPADAAASELDGLNCDVAGWAGTWKGGANGYCSAGNREVWDPSQNVSGKCSGQKDKIQCNPDLYGDSSCVDFSVKNRGGATKACNDSDPSGDKFAKAFASADLKTKEAMAAQIKQATDKANDIYNQACGDKTVQTFKHKGDDPYDACVNLKAQRDMLNNTTCPDKEGQDSKNFLGKVLSKDQVKVYCARGPAPITPPAPPTAVTDRPCVDKPSDDDLKKCSYTNDSCDAGGGKQKSKEEGGWFLSGSASNSSFEPSADHKSCVQKGSTVTAVPPGKDPAACKVPANDNCPSRTIRCGGTDFETIDVGVKVSGWRGQDNGNDTASCVQENVATDSSASVKDKKKKKSEDDSIDWWPLLPLGLLAAFMIVGTHQMMSSNNNYTNSIMGTSTSSGPIAAPPVVQPGTAPGRGAF